MSAHTPGPWKQGPQTSECAEVIIGNGDYIMVRCDDPDVEWENARLIAAAPDLLAALRDLLADVEGGGSHSDTSTRTRARAAIARAEGAP